MAGSGETVNRVAHQASDQGRSEGVVSRLEVVRSCRVGVSFGSTLPRCVRVKAHRILVDGRAKGQVRSKTKEMWLSRQSDNGLACERSSGTPYGDLFGVTGAIL
jgi:hypothetical protein